MVRGEITTENTNKSDSKPSGSSGLPTPSVVRNPDGSICIGTDCFTITGGSEGTTIALNDKSECAKALIKDFGDLIKAGPLQGKPTNWVLPQEKKETKIL